MNTSSILVGAGQSSQPNKKTFSLKRSRGSFEENLDEKIQKNLALERERLRKAAHGLEATLINQMIKAMRSTIHRDDNPLYGGQAEDIFQEMLDHKHSEMISNSSKMGLATQIYNQMLRYVKWGGEKDWPWDKRLEYVVEWNRSKNIANNGEDNDKLSFFIRKRKFLW